MAFIFSGGLSPLLFLKYLLSPLSWTSPTKNRLLVCSPWTVCWGLEKVHCITPESSAQEAFHGPTSVLRELNSSSDPTVQELETTAFGCTPDTRQHTSVHIFQQKAAIEPQAPHVFTSWHRFSRLVTPCPSTDAAHVGHQQRA